MSSNRRRRLVGGNWKMNLLSSDAESYCRAMVADLGAGPEIQTEVVLFPPSPFLKLLAAELSGSPVAWGGQDIHPDEKGAHTGDVSGGQLVDCGATWTLCGHSERRAAHHESDELVGAKATAAVGSGLTPLICVGESEDERQSGRTFEILERQVSAALAGRPEPFALAYEPIWAIGTGRTATPESAQETHRFLRETLADLLGDEAAATKRILYGGSVTPDNAADLIAQKDIDGFLVGGASLDPARFMAIIRSCG